MSGFPLIDTGKVRVRQCRRGLVLFNPNDEYVGRSFDLYGEFSEGEATLFRQYVNEGDTVADVGANIGAHTINLSRLVGDKGNVWAFEPQPVIFNMLCANVALNSLTNVFPRREAVGETNSEIDLAIPDLDHSKMFNYGGVRLEAFECKPNQTAVTVRALDVEILDFVKIDVEGMELEVLKGMGESLFHSRPILYVENDKRDKSPALIKFLLDAGYQLWWHCPPLFNPMNYAQLKQNVFANIVSVNMLCLPNGRIPAPGGQHIHPVQSPEHWILSQ